METVLALIGDNRDVALFLAGVLISWKILGDYSTRFKQKRNGGTHEDKTLVELRALNTSMSNLTASVETSNRIFVDIIEAKK